MKKPKPDIDRIFAERVLIDEAVKKAGREARLLYQRLGLKAHTWRDGKIIEVSPWDTPDESADKAQSGQNS